MLLGALRIDEDPDLRVRESDGGDLADGVDAFQGCLEAIRGFG